MNNLETMKKLYAKKVKGIITTEEELKLKLLISTCCLNRLVLKHILQSSISDEP